jgi:hypothetical protein
MGEEYGDLVGSLTRGSKNSSCLETTGSINGFGEKTKLVFCKKEGTDSQKAINAKMEKNAKGISRRKIITESFDGFKKIAQLWNRNSLNIYEIN